MKISSMTISNLYSYSYTKANFEDFNIVVGHNVAGKTNLIRMLKILVKDPGVRKGEKYIPISFDDSKRQRRNLVYIKKGINNDSQILTKPSKPQINIAPYLFKSDLFFSKCSIFVEGVGDASALAAISDALGSIFERHDIFLVDSGGMGNIDNYHDVVSSYRVNYVAMVDHEYQGWTSTDFTILPGKLENELQNLGWTGNVNSSIDPQEAYDFIFGKMQNDNDKKMVKQSGLGSVFNAVLRKVNTDPDSIW